MTNPYVRIAICVVRDKGVNPCLSFELCAGCPVACWEGSLDPYQNNRTDRAKIYLSQFSEEDLLEHLV